MVRLKDFNEFEQCKMAVEHVQILVGATAGG